MALELLFPQVDLSTVQGVLIDIDDTLYLYEPAHQAALQACYKLFLAHTALTTISFAEFKATYRLHRTEVTQRLAGQGACRSRLLAFQSLYENLALKSAFNEALAQEGQYWQTFFTYMQVNLEALAFLQRCAQQQIPVCVISDMQVSIQIQKLQVLGLSQLINFLVTSEECGIEKPAAALFTRALSKLKLSAAHVIMIGDHLEKDIVGAQTLGIRTYQVKILNEDV